ncbi:MAG: class I SAM-dependent methyltransferase [Alphaproteobacteria bacterium]
MLTSAFDPVAPTFDEHRTLPAGVPEKVRAAIMSATDARDARYLDIGAGSGRFGAAFADARDDYVGLDLSAGMLQAFRQRSVGETGAPRLVQADGASLPFRDATFDVVLMMHVFGGLADWRALAHEAARVLRPNGVVAVGRTMRPPDGLDARMKRRARDILCTLEAGAERVNRRDDVMTWFNDRAAGRVELVAAHWNAQRTPRAFIARHRGGARFCALPASVQAQAVRELADWAVTQFGSLDHASIEPHGLAITIFSFSSGGVA